MRTVHAAILLDSISPQGKRLTTFQITAHRFILAEINTHRVFSRNYRSSRAVPTAKLIEEVRTNPAMPVFWGKNQPGMQAAEELYSKDLFYAKSAWKEAARDAAIHAHNLMTIGVHKQLVNRGLEAYLYVHGVITATNYANFFKLRCDAQAQPEIKALADAMREAYEASTPELLEPDYWHMPYVDSNDVQSAVSYCLKEYATGTPEVPDYPESPELMDVLRRVSAARCARVSYKVFDADRKPTIEEDLKLADQLVSSGHWSPFEHQARPDEFKEYIYSDDFEWTDNCNDDYGWQCSNRHGNFEGWVQYRKTFPGEYIK